MKKLIIFLICSITATAFPQQGWFWQNPQPQGNTLNSIHFVDDYLGWAVGEGGTILKTTDGGESWADQKKFTIYNLLDIFFIDSEIGIIVGGNHKKQLGQEVDYESSYGTIIRTTDGGNSWNEYVGDTFKHLNDINL